MTTPPRLLLGVSCVQIVEVIIQIPEPDPDAELLLVRLIGDCSSGSVKDHLLLSLAASNSIHLQCCILKFPLRFDGEGLSCYTFLSSLVFLHLFSSSD